MMTPEELRKFLLEHNLKFSGDVPYPRPPGTGQLGTQGWVGWLKPDTPLYETKKQQNKRLYAIELIWERIARWFYRGEEPAEEEVVQLRNIPGTIQNRMWMLYRGEDPDAIPPPSGKGIVYEAPTEPYYKRNEEKNSEDSDI